MKQKYCTDTAIKMAEDAKSLLGRAEGWTAHFEYVDGVLKAKAEWHVQPAANRRPSRWPRPSPAEQAEALIPNLVALLGYQVGEMGHAGGLYWTPSGGGTLEVDHSGNFRMDLPSSGKRWWDRWSLEVLYRTLLNEKERESAL